MRKQIFSVFLLSIFSSSLIIPYGINVQDQRMNEREIKSDNPNNHPMVIYNNADSWTGYGEEMNFWVTESGDTVSLSTYHNNQDVINIPLYPGLTFVDFRNDLDEIFLTIYDVTDSENPKIVEYITLYNDPSQEISFSVNGSTVSNSTYINLDTNIYEVENLVEYHDYRVGLNINKGDDLQIYSNIVRLDVPKLTTFDVESTDTSVTINYELSQSNSDSPTTSFEYNEIYIQIDGRKINLGTEPTGQITIDGLKPAREYDINFVYDANKVITGLGTTIKPLKETLNLSISTSVPGNYSSEVIQISLILLIILIIILLIFLIVIFYWNHQRRKINGLALVVGEDTQAYDPVYDYNYHQGKDYSVNDDVYYSDNNELEYYEDYSDESSISSKDGYDGYYYDEDEYYEDENNIDDYEGF